ncbi:olfactory receptor 52K2-like [Aquarana catesbeiana]|uniref:olfactory receptor 52K2-like n=1 Tax=Aquarana catesbeiana TaxID=8400 RepID=UPI003CC9EA2C
MLLANLSIFYPSVFFLEGLPGFESAHTSLSIPVFIMYIMAILGNGFILIIIVSQKPLHSPMYYFLCTLSLTDVVLSSSIVLKMLAIFWMNDKEITFLSCLVQMFFIHCFTSLESGVLMAMALDRYVAICNPLRYTATLTNSLILKITIALIIRGTVIVTPCPLMASLLPFCQTHHISHSYCDHMAVVKLACADTTINSAYGLTVVLLCIVFDVSVIAMSYILILRTMLKLSSQTDKSKAFGTCSSHISTIIMFYTLGLFSFLTHRVGHIEPYIHVILSSLYLLTPPALNPIIYGVKTKEIRTAAYNLLSQSVK